MMIRRSLLLLSLVLCNTIITRADESYPVHADTRPRDGVPRGRVESFTFDRSGVYPGTTREVFVYLPAQLENFNEPAALMVFQDGRNYVAEKGDYQMPTVFDNLIDGGQMPVTVAVCVNPGVVPAAGQGQDRFNRSYEYDSVSPTYAKFLLDEILPEVARRYQVPITNDPNLRGIGGSSSGAVAAFGVAWHRPESFRRVFSTVGTYVGLRGGDQYETLVRKTEPKPLRVFLQDGSNDLDIYAGGWWPANQAMLQALQYAGYEVKNEWGEGGHNNQHAAAIFPDAMRWLWQDWQTPITAPAGDHPELSSRLIAGEDWRVIASLDDPLDGQIEQLIPAGDDVFVQTTESDRLLKFNGQSFDLRDVQPGIKVDLGSLGRLTERLRDYELPQHEDDLDSPGTFFSKISAVTLSPDRRFLIAAVPGQRHLWSLRVQRGQFDAAQAYHYLHAPPGRIDPAVTGLAMTRTGEVIAATAMGLQVFDQPGRVHVILPLPGGKRATGLTTAGPGRDWLITSDGETIYARRTRMVGHRASDPAVTPDKPRL